MATSGSNDFKLTRDELINSSLRVLNVIGEGQVANTSQLSDGSQALNILVKSLQNKGNNLWTSTWAKLALNSTSVVTNGGTTYECLEPHTSSATDEPGVGANWQAYWVESNKTATGAWALSTSYTFSGVVDLGINYIGLEQAFVRENSGGSISDYNLTKSSFTDYLNLIDKSVDGLPQNIYSYERLDSNGDTNLSLYMYPAPDDVSTQQLHVLATRHIYDFDSATDNPDIPVRWSKVLKFGLAVEMAPEYGIFGERLSQISDIYLDALNDARKEDSEQYIRFASPSYPPV